MVEELRFEKAADALKKKLRQREAEIKKKKISRNQIISKEKKERPLIKPKPAINPAPKIKGKKITEIETKKVSLSTGPLAKLKSDVLMKKRQKLVEVKIERDARESKPLPKVYSEPAAKKKIDELSRFIAEGVERDEGQEERASIAEQLGSIKKYFSRGLKKSIGKKEINKVYLKQLSQHELMEAKKLIPLLEPETKRYARQEIFEAIVMEGHSKKVAHAVIGALYQID